MNKEYKDKLIDDYSQSADSFYPDTDVMGLMYVTKIMSEYAEKEAIAFAEWIMKNSWQQYQIPDGWVQEDGDSSILTTKELYQIYKSQNK